MKYKGHFRITTIILISIICTACQSRFPVSPTPDSAQVRENDAVFHYRADLTHDGTDEEIIVNLADIIADNQQPARILVNSDTGTPLWQQELYLPHDGWGSYYLYEEAGMAFLLYYLPELSQGQGIYSYRVFYLDEKGAETETATGTVEFDSYPPSYSAPHAASLPTSEPINFPVENMLKFAADINSFFDNSFLLVSTVDLSLTYSTPENKVTYHEEYRKLLDEGRIP